MAVFLRGRMAKHQWSSKANSWFLDSSRQIASCGQSLDLRNPPTPAWLKISLLLQWAHRSATADGFMSSHRPRWHGGAKPWCVCSKVIRIALDRDSELTPQFALNPAWSAPPSSRCELPQDWRSNGAIPDIEHTRERPRHLGISSVSTIARSASRRP